MTRRRSSPGPRRRASSSGTRRRPVASQEAGQLRIIGGDYRRRRLPVLDSPGLRPTPDRVRETLFNWLTGELHGARVLDLFAGTGALGLEALSRGAREAVFVERTSAVARQLEANLATLGAAGRVVTADAETFLAGEASSFALVFLDPPFRQHLAEPCCERLESDGWLAETAWVYLEVEAGLDPRVPATWTLHREVWAGDSHGRLYLRQPTP